MSKEVVKTNGRTDLKYRHASVANVILNASYELSIVEKRIIFITLSHMDSSKEVSSLTEYEMSVEDYAGICGISIKKAYELLREGCDKLFERKLVTYTEKGKIENKFRWVQAIKFHGDERKIKLKWSADIVPYISDLTSNFTRLVNKDYIPIESKYTSRLYDLLYQHKWKGKVGKVEIAIEKLIELWNIPESCQEFKFLNNRILKEAIKELGERNLARVEVAVTKKVDRKASEIQFSYWFV